MAIYSDSVEFAAEVLPDSLAPRTGTLHEPATVPGPLLAALWGHRRPRFASTSELPGWNTLLLTADASRSQCDQLSALLRGGHRLSDRSACLARTGRSFHGFKGRSWSAAPGNIHLAVHFAPGCPIERFEVAFTILAAVSVIDAVDGVPGLPQPPGIRWVNDIVVGDAKIGGVIAYTQTQGPTVNSAVLGIGLNVETTPEVEPTPFVPRVASLNDMAVNGTHVALRDLLHALLDALRRNYDLLLHSGYRPLLERYRRRSTVIGRECTVCTEESDLQPRILASGRLAEIGDGLELFVDGWRRPITRGRLFVGRPKAPWPGTRSAPRAPRATQPGTAVQAGQE